MIKKGTFGKYLGNCASPFYATKRGQYLVVTQVLNSGSCMVTFEDGWQGCVISDNIKIDAVPLELLTYWRLTGKFRDYEN
jgi:hypothetical protein